MSDKTEIAGVLTRRQRKLFGNSERYSDGNAETEAISEVPEVVGSPSTFRGSPESCGQREGQGSILSYGKSVKNSSSRLAQRTCSADKLSLSTTNQSPVASGLSPRPSPKRTPSLTSLTDEQKELELKKFDLDQTYGPCRDITRLERFQRGLRFNLTIPGQVKSILEDTDEASKFRTCIWDQQFSY